MSPGEKKNLAIVVYVSRCLFFSFFPVCVLRCVLQQVDGKPGGELGDTELIRGIVIDKEFSHAQVQNQASIVEHPFLREICELRLGGPRQYSERPSERAPTLRHPRALAPINRVVGHAPPQPWRVLRVHVQMPKIVKDAKLCLLTCPFEPPKPKTKHKLDITSRDAYEKLFEREQKYFADMVKQCKDVGTNLVSLL